jgi:hypothetical protein
MANLNGVLTATAFPVVISLPAPLVDARNVRTVPEEVKYGIKYVVVLFAELAVRREETDAPANVVGDTPSKMNVPSLAISAFRGLSTPRVPAAPVVMMGEVAKEPSSS